MIQQDDLAALATAARLELTTAEEGIFRSRLNEILAYMEKSLATDVSGVEPFTFVHTITNVLREDVVEPSFSQETALANAPAAQDGQFLVPRII